uniref:Uncharacterized protein n=1 Tax=Glossina palpalis gambiensis TaxID=67801 RepID=A0A1B0BTI8_9MUSC
TSAPRLQQPIDFHENFDNEEAIFNVILDDLFLNSDLIRKEVNEDSMLLEQSYGSPLSTCTHSSPSPNIGPEVAGAPPSSPMVGVMWRRLSPELFGMITPRLMGSSLVHGFIGSLVVVVLAGSSIVIVRTVIDSAVGVMMVTSSASSTGSLALARASPSSVANLSSTAAIFIRGRWSSAAVHQAKDKACGSHLASSCCRYASRFRSRYTPQSDWLACGGTWTFRSGNDCESQGKSWPKGEARWTWSLIPAAVVEPAAGGQPLEIPVGDVDFGIGSESAIHAAV